MTSAIETVILNLQRFGAYQFLFPFILTAAVFYGLLRRSQLFGKPEENIAINAVVSLVAAFMVWAYPILAGVNVEIMLSRFFFQGTLASLVIVVGLLIVSMFSSKGLGETLEEKFTGKGMWIGILALGLLIGFGVFFSSGVYEIFFPEGVTEVISEDVIISAIVLLGIFVFMFLIVFLTSREKK